MNLEHYAIPKTNYTSIIITGTNPAFDIPITLHINRLTSKIVRITLMVSIGPIEVINNLVLQRSMGEDLYYTVNSRMISGNENDHIIFDDQCEGIDNLYSYRLLINLKNRVSITTAPIFLESNHESN
jgi:hypothetical protein